MTNKEKAKEIFKILTGKTHPNLYHDISKDDLVKYFNSIDWNQLDDLHFDFEMIKLFSLIKESHTFYSDKKFPWEMINSTIKEIDGKFYIKENNLYYEIISINDIEIDDIINKFRGIISAEDGVWANYLISVKMQNVMLYKFLKITDNDKLVFKVKREKEYKTFEKTINKIESLKSDKSSSFKFENNFEIKDSILVLNFVTCDSGEIENFNKLVKEIEECYNKNLFNYYIVNATINNGGVDRLIDPFIDFINKNKIQGVVTTGITCYSSGLISVLKLREQCGAKVIGEIPAQPLIAYGDYKKFEVDDKEFFISTKLVDLNKSYNLKNQNKFLIPDKLINPTIKEREQNINVIYNNAVEFVKTNYINCPNKNF